MPTQIKIELTPEAKAISARLRALPQTALQAVARAMNDANQIAKAKIEHAHLTGVGPFPPTEHKLGMVTSRLRTSVNASRAVVEGDTITSAIGSNVIYAAIHEFGGTIHHKARQGKVRLRKDKDGNLIRQPLKDKDGKPKASYLAMFARASHQRVKEVAYEAKAYDIEMPARAPFQTGIQESAANYTRAISAELIKAMKGS